MRCDANLYFPNQTAPRSGPGARKKYGDKIDFDNLPTACLQSSTIEKRVKTSIYQATLLHTLFDQPLNVVIIYKINWATNKQAHVILFSTDLSLPAEQLIDFYCLRFQIEFNFRDAKQYWGLLFCVNAGELSERLRK
ncbi:MAG TPA: transposase [Anaerolineae bacterium]|nr:transposase [Anaerolineae bacterium]